MNNSGCVAFLESVSFLLYFFDGSLRKHAYSNILKILRQKKKKKKKKEKKRGGSYEYPQSVFSNKIRKIMYTPVNPSFTI